jgi:hypothetical protein
VTLGSAWWQIINPAFAFNKANIFTKEFVTITHSGSAAKDKELGASTSEGDVYATPVTH